MKMKKTALVGAIAIAVAGVAPEMAAAHSSKTKHTHKRAVSSHSSSSTTVQSSLERRLQAMEAEITSLRSELARSRSEARAEIKANNDADAAHVAAVEEKLAKRDESVGKDLLFFRGGYAKMEHARTNELLTDNNNLPVAGHAPKDGEGWYVGAGFDHHLTDDVWGLWDGASVAGEVMFEYKNFGHSYNTLVDHVTANTLGGGNSVTTIKNQITQFTLTASPKIKFNGLGDFTPWIIPVGLGIHVISPPSSGVTVLNPGLMVGAGGEYRLFKSLVAGLDFRYHFTGDDLKYRDKAGVLRGVDTDGFTTGAYLGFGF